MIQNVGEQYVGPRGMPLSLSDANFVAPETRYKSVTVAHFGHI